MTGKAQRETHTHTHKATVHFPNAHKTQDRARQRLEAIKSMSAMWAAGTHVFVPSLEPGAELPPELRHSHCPKWQPTCAIFITCNPKEDFLQNQPISLFLSSFRSRWELGGIQSPLGICFP